MKWCLVFWVRRNGSALCVVNVGEGANATGIGIGIGGDGGIQRKLKNKPENTVGRRKRKEKKRN